MNFMNLNDYLLRMKLLRIKPSHNRAGQLVRVNKAWLDMYRESRRNFPYVGVDEVFTGRKYIVHRSEVGGLLDLA